MIVVDTNVASELMRAAPDPTVRRWVDARRGADLGTTAITVAEIRYGIARLPAGSRKNLLAEIADEVFAAFEDQILPFDAAAAAQYASILSRREPAGLPIDGFDAQIAAICQVHAASLATRNAKDFDRTGVALIDPWVSGSGRGS